VSIFAKSAHYLRSIGPSVRNYQKAAPNGRISLKLDLGVFYTNPSRGKKTKLVEIGQNYRAIYMKTSERRIVASDKISSQKERSILLAVTRSSTEHTGRAF
jgi:hypothetical protein